MRDRYPPVISPGIYLLTCQFSKYSKELVFVITAVLKEYEKRNLPKNCQFFP
jgi:hypothetical protein